MYFLRCMSSFLRCMPSFLARKIQPFLSLVDREVEIYVRFTSLGMCVCVVFFSQIILDIKFVGRTSRGHTGGRSHRISHPPPFGGACLNFFFSREGFSHSYSSATVKSIFVQSAPRPSEHPPVKHLCFILFYLF